MLKRFFWFPLLPVGIAGLVMSALSLPATHGADKDASGWTQLFNNKDLTGWTTWLGRPQGAKEVIGLNKDPKQVYTVVDVDGKPAIRISGEIFGALTSKDEFENYHLRLEFKWGEKKWPPREKAKRDSGLLYHCIEPQGVNWMKSLECQIQEQDCGDFWSVAGPIVDVEGVRPHEKAPITYKKGGTKFRGVKSRIIRDQDYEKPGAWNTIELLAVGQTSVHLVNGKPNMVLTNIRHAVGAKEVPLTRGKIQLQSEAAEIFYRNIAVRPLKQIPSVYLQ